MVLHFRHLTTTTILETLNSVPQFQPKFSPTSTEKESYYHCYYSMVLHYMARMARFSAPLPRYGSMINSSRMTAHLLPNLPSNFCLLALLWASKAATFACELLAILVIKYDRMIVLCYWTMTKLCFKVGIFMDTSLLRGLQRDYLLLLPTKIQRSFVLTPYVKYTDTFWH